MPVTDKKNLTRLYWKPHERPQVAEIVKLLVFLKRYGYFLYFLYVLNSDLIINVIFE